MIPCLSLALLIILHTTRGVCGESWGVTLSHGDICAVTGSSVVMPCSFTHPPHLTVTDVCWIINASPGKPSIDLRNHPQYEGRVQYSADKEKNCTMTLSDVRDTDTALYYARIETNTQGERWLSSSVSLRVKDLVVQISGAAIEGQEVKLSCVSGCSLRQNSGIVWMKDRRVLAFTQTHNNELTFHSISTEDEGEYSCAVEVHEYYPAPPLKITVMYPPKNTLASISPAGEILEGSSVTLTCSSDANPPVQSYTWYRRRGGASSVVGSQQNYSMTNITSEHSGLYYCMAENQHGSSYSTDVRLNVQYPPKTTLASVSPSGEILEGNTVSLSCSSDANPPVQSYTWHKMNESAVPKAAAHQNYSISAVRSELSGDYYCQAQNKHGNRNSTVIHINVLYPPKRTTALLYHMGDLEEGSSVILTCSSDANPPVETYTWYRRTGDKTTEVGSGQTHSFTLTSATAGLYHCQANNRHGYQNGSVIEVSISGGVQWQTVGLCVLGAMVAAETLGLGLMYCRRKTRGPTAVSGDTGKDTGDDDDNYENDPQRGNPGAIQMSSVNRSHNPNTTQPDDLYQSLNPNTTQPDDLYQSLNPNTTQPDDLYQSLNPNTIQPDAVYQSLRV